MVTNDASDLDQLRAAFVPRDEGLCRRLSAVVVPTANLVFAGIIWASLGGGLSLLPTALVGYLLYRVLPPAADGTDPVLVYTTLGVFVLATIAVWLRFAHWAGGRRARARALFRDGQFVQARVQGLRQVVGRRQQRGTIVTVTFAAEAQTLRAEIFLPQIVKSVGHDGALPLLYLPGYGFGAAFPVDGTLARAVISG